MRIALLDCNIWDLDGKVHRMKKSLFAPKQKKTAKAENPYSTKQFYLEDYPRTLFPLTTNRIVIENGEQMVLAYLEDCLAGMKSFSPQHRVFAAKDPLHLRRTVKLDPVAEYFIYDLIYRNRARFRKPHLEERAHYGYRFEDGIPRSASRDYQKFKSAVFADGLVEPFIGFDISAYFNSLYHHDLEAWLAALDASNDDVQMFSKFLREINAGRSIDCLPHGLYPTKMIGNDFLRFIEESTFLKATSIHRFMDDVYLFGKTLEDVQSDFDSIQRVLGLKGLGVNQAKTKINESKAEKTDASISSVKKNLLQRRRDIIAGSLYDDDSGDEPTKAELTDEELEEINEILKAGDIEEDDAELILTVMRTHADDVLSFLPGIISRFPHLAKNVYKFCADIEDPDAVADMIDDLLDINDSTQEYQLFWFAMMLDSYLMPSKRAPKIVAKLLGHRNRTDISVAKVLEISDHRYGLPDVRQGYLSSGRSDWLSWSSAVGSRSVKPAARNYMLEYFMKSSPMNRLIGEVVQSI